MGDTCAEHGQFCEKIGEIHSCVKSLDSLIKSHVLEADRPGGIRDRVATLEAASRILQGELLAIQNSYKDQKRDYWKACIVSGVVGGLLARLAPDLIFNIVEYALKRIAA